MAEKVDKTIVQMKIRGEVTFILDELLGEDLYRHCFITGDDAWTFRYNYVSTATFPDETIYSGHVSAKTKRKYAHLIDAREHRFAFCARARGRYDVEVRLERDDEGSSNKAAAP